MEHVLFYLILGERKELSRHVTFNAAMLEAKRRKDNYCGSSLYIDEAAKHDATMRARRKEDREFTKAFTPNRHGEYA